jgi:Flp pilus assembly protein TadD
MVRTAASKRRCHSLIILTLLLPVGLAGCGARPAPASPTLSLESRLRLAEALQGAAGSPASVAVLRQAAQERPRDAALRERWATAAERAGLDAEAAQALREAIALDGPSRARLLALGRLQLRTGDVAAAAATFTEARDMAPADPAVLDGLGLAQDLAGNPAQAQESYRAALALAPRNWGVRANYAMSLLLSGQSPQAVEILAEAEYAPAAPHRARHNLALALVATGQPDRALRLLRLDMGPVEAEQVCQEMAAVGARVLGRGEAAGRAEAGAPVPVAGGKRPAGTAAGGAASPACRPA